MNYYSSKVESQLPNDDDDDDDDGRDLSSQNFLNESSICADDAKAVPLAIASKLHSHQADHSFWPNGVSMDLDFRTHDNNGGSSISFDL